MILGFSLVEDVNFLRRREEEEWLAYHPLNS